MNRTLRKRLSIAGFSFALTLTAAFPAHAADLSGRLDSVEQDKIVGWAWDKDAPDNPVFVELTLAGGNGPNGTVTLTVTANQARADLKKALGSSAHGFTLDIDWNEYEGETFAVTAAIVSGDERKQLEERFTYTKNSETASAAQTPKKEKAASNQESEAATLAKDAEKIGPGFDLADTSSKSKNSEDRLKAGETSGPSIHDGDSAGAYETGKQGAHLGEYVASGYCNCSKCSGGSGLTYSGTVPKARHTIAADQDVFPIGTKLMIDGIIYTVEDIGSGIQNNRLDIYFDTHQEALDFGLQKVQVYAVEAE